MSQFDAGTWANTTTDFDASAPPEPGIYEVLLEDGRAFTANSGKDFLVLTWRIATGPHAGHQWDALHGFGSEGAVKVAKSMLIKIGIDTDAIRSLDEMDRAVKHATGDWYVVEVKQNGEYRNTYVTSKIKAPASGSDVPADPDLFQTTPDSDTADDSSVPF